MTTSFPTPASHSRRFPFDRVGSIALICAGLFIAAATGLTMLLG